MRSSYVKHLLSGSLKKIVLTKGLSSNSLANGRRGWTSFGIPSSALALFVEAKKWLLSDRCASTDFLFLTIVKESLEAIDPSFDTFLQRKCCL